MNRLISPAAAATASILVLSVGLGACGGSSGPSKKDQVKANAQSLLSQQRTVTKGTSSFTINPGTETKLKLAGITVTPGAPGVAQGATTLIPADSGVMIVKHMIGSLHGNASITFAKGPDSVKFDRIVVNTSKRRVSGIVNGKRETLYHLHLRGVKVVATKNTRFTGTGITVTLARQAAVLLDKTLKVNVFRPEQPFGLLTVDVFAEAPKAPTSTASTTAATTTTGK